MNDWSQWGEGRESSGGGNLASDLFPGFLDDLPPYVLNGSLEHLDQTVGKVLQLSEHSGQLLLDLLDLAGLGGLFEPLRDGALAPFKTENGMKFFIDPGLLLDCI